MNLLLGLAVMWAACDRGGGEGAERPALEHRPRVALARFEIAPTVVIPWWDPIETNVLHDETTQSLVQSEVLDVVERTRLDRIMAEQRLTTDQVTDPAQAAALGKVLGARYFVLGVLRAIDLGRVESPLPYTRRRIRMLRGVMRVDVRVVEVDTSRIVLSESIEAVREREGLAVPDDVGELRTLYQEVQQHAGDVIAQRVVDQLVPVRVAAVDGASVELNRGTSTGLEAGQLFDVLGPARRTVARIEVTAVERGGARGAIVGQTGDVGTGMECEPVPAAPPPPPEARPDPLEDRW